MTRRFTHGSCTMNENILNNCSYVTGKVFINKAKVFEIGFT